LLAFHNLSHGRRDSQCKSAPGSWGSGHETIVLDHEFGMVNIDVVKDRIVAVEVHYRNDVRAALLKLLG
jgi:hypothetical protein